MEVKPGYKLTEVGVFPKDWDIVQLGSIAEVEGGYAFSSKAFLASGTYQVVKMSNLYGGTLDLERSASFLNELTEQERHYLLRPNHIILTLTGTTGKRDYGYSYMVTHEQNLLLNQRVGRVVVSDNSCAGFVSLQLRSPCFLNQFFELSKGGTGNQTNVGTKDVTAMRIPVPTLPEQRAIATALSDVDGLLGGLDRLIAKKRNLKQAAMQQLLTGQTRLPGFQGEWEVKRLGDVAVLYQPVTISANQFTESGYPVYGANGVVGFYRDFNHGSWQVTVTCRGSTSGTVNRTVEKCWITGNAMVVGCDHNKDINKEFLYYVLSNEDLSVCITGTGQPQIVREPLANVELRLPSDATEQTAIAEVLTEMDAELAALEQRREKTSALKQAMMQELLTGRTRLVGSQKATT